MKIIIVGAGIAGLSAAIALRRAGHSVIILEKSAMAHEIGAALHIHPNATRILDRWGFSPERTRLISATSSLIADGESLNTLFFIPPVDNVFRYGAELWYAHRVDLHNELKFLATRVADGVPGEPAEILVKKRAVEFDIELGQVTCEDGSMYRGDLIIGADGIHSVAVKTVIGRAVTVKEEESHSSFRMFIPHDEIMAIEDDTVKGLLEGSEGRFNFYEDSVGTKLIWFPCRGNHYIGMASPNMAEGVVEADWTANADLPSLLKRAQKFHPALQSILKKATEIKLWKMTPRDPLPFWHKGRLLLIGDAAHSMLPFQGQGAAQAIEDAAALEVIFRSTTTSTISTRLNIFETVRRNRATVVQLLSNNQGRAAPLLKEIVAPFIDGGADAVPLTFEAQRDWKFRYDVVKECEAIMAQCDPLV